MALPPPDPRSCNVKRRSPHFATLEVLKQRRGEIATHQDGASAVHAMDGVMHGLHCVRNDSIFILVGAPEGRMGYLAMT